MYKLISDSSCDIAKDRAKELKIDYVPFKITIEGHEFIDDDQLDLDEFLTAMEKTPHPIKTACPSPYDYLSVIEEHIEKEIYIITISSKLSGSYNSANTAKMQALEKYPKARIKIIDSKSAASGQTKIALEALEILEKNLSFEDSCDALDQAVERMNTFFVLDNMQNLIKNGRIKKTTGLIADVLHIRPIMRGLNGEIQLYEMNRGTKRALNSLAKTMGEVCDNLEDRLVCISHVNALERAEKFAEKIQKLYHPKRIVITQSNGLSSGYADIGGIVLAF
ncbi:MAG: DegV family protein [Tissierellia bacterium]|nr:DegV family protein [Tissierellia bacterium]